jgi:hypothetical protein
MHALDVKKQYYLLIESLTNISELAITELTRLVGTGDFLVHDLFFQIKSVTELYRRMKEICHKLLSPLLRKHLTNKSLNQFMTNVCTIMNFCFVIRVKTETPEFMTKCYECNAISKSDAHFTLTYYQELVFWFMEIFKLFSKELHATRMTKHNK